MIGQARMIRFGSMLLSDLPLSLFTVGYNEQKHMVRPEGFPAVQILLARSGTGTFDSDETGQFDLGPNEFLVIPPSVPHEYYPLPGHAPWEVGFVSLTGSNVGDLLKHFGFEYGKVMKLQASEEVWEHLDRLWLVADQRSDDVEWVAAEMLYGFLLLLKKWSRRSSETADGTNENTRSLTAVDRAAAMIRENYAEPMQVSQLARSLGYTHQHLNLLFQRKYGTTLNRYLQRIRFEASLPLLRDHNLPVHEVARRVGLEIGSFIRLFRQSCNSTPGNWRKKNE